MDDEGGTSRTWRRMIPCGLQASRMAFSAGGPAPWDPLPRGFALGSGPTIVHAQGPVSRREEDATLVTAAGRGAADEVKELLAHASSPNVLARRVTENGSHAHATTALHAAAAKGSLECVQMLLDGGADPRRKQSGLRMLTPLHEAANMDVAKALLSSGASPVAQDPREPDPAWYHRQRGRHKVADIISAAARRDPLGAQQRRRTQADMSIAVTGAEGVPAPKAFPSMSSAEAQRARQAWSLMGADMYALVLSAAGKCSRTKEAAAALVPERLREVLDLECAICMTGLGMEEECVILPCGLLGRSHATSSSATAETEDAAEGEAPVGGEGRRSRRSARRTRSASTSEADIRLDIAGRLHAFHVTCLDKWWTKSCRCPTCRRDVRQWLQCSNRSSTPSTAASSAASSPCGASAHSARRKSRCGGGLVGFDPPELRRGFAPPPALRARRPLTANAARRSKFV